MLKHTKLVSAVIWILMFVGGAAQLRAQAAPQSLSAAAGDPMGATVLGSTLLFTADDGINGRELWVSDGTPGGTMMLLDIRPGSGSGLDAGDRVFTASAGLLYFAANDGIAGKELWRTDGTVAGTVMVADINPGAVGSMPTEMVDLFGEVVFQADDGVAGAELWKSDGTVIGTQLVFDVFPGQLLFLPPNSGSPRNLYTSNTYGLVFFSAINASNGEELWVSDGTAFGTMLLSDVNPGLQPPFNQPISSTPRGFVDFFGLVFFVADGPAGSELFATDGSSAFQVADLNPTGDAAPASLTATSQSLLFVANDGVNGRELWSHDGSGFGVSLVRDINLAAGQDGVLGELYPTAGGVAFAGQVSAGQAQLWQSDGTTLGTSAQTAILTAPEGFEARDITEVGSNLYWRANSEFAAGRSLGLWTNRNPIAPASPLGDIGSGSNAALDAVNVESSFTAIGSRLFFVGTTAIDGPTLWSFDTNLTPAAVGELGEGCGPTGADARMRSTRPVVGQNVTWALSGMTPGRVGDIYLTLGSPAVLPLGFGCGAFISLAPLTPFVPFVTDSNGDWAFAFPLPGDPGLVGLNVTVQGAIIGTTGALGIDLSNGLLLALGN